jgi:hypothetical protein
MSDQIIGRLQEASGHRKTIDQIRAIEQEQLAAVTGQEWCPFAVAFSRGERCQPAHSFARRVECDDLLVLGENQVLSIVRNLGEIPLDRSRKSTLPREPIRGTEPAARVAGIDQEGVLSLWREIRPRVQDPRRLWIKVPPEDRSDQRHERDDAVSGESSPSP